MRIHFLILLFLSFFCTNMAHAAAKIGFDKEVYKFGTAQYGDKIGQKFVVTNLGSDPLIIGDVQADCGCTKTLKGSSEIPANSSSEISVEYDTEGERSGKKEKHIFVHSNDPERPIVKLSLVGELIKELEVDPPTFAQKLETFQEDISIPVKIKNTSDTARKITAIKTAEKVISVGMEPKSLVVEPNTSAPLTIMLHLKKQDDRPFYLGRIALQTDHPVEKELNFRFLVQITGKK
ncbi:DUF1573 domain-containing protein [Desulfomonile tiedjei]|uniref:DUF1573 domain-containing protein n=1 Tax=Desulfomonile tiedjei (strain ATCC 49306 / DSM 6799 / DCB-1) TaxID=706587 RepID=I4C039_DESTA|nr:DUF1573 domain-containing protein [Desulfomonile tiedjei]AFM22930.1 Protein of unknown function (DUF1573) [Desulfomonile tiedjei DSM 6799]